jgi:hypothetical protein
MKRLFNLFSLPDAVSTYFPSLYKQTIHRNRLMNQGLRVRILRQSMRRDEG